MIIQKQELFENAVSLKKPQETEKGVFVRRGVLLTKEGAFLVHYTDDLDTLYSMLECHTIDIVTRSIFHKSFDLVVDDEGRMKDGNHVQAVSSKGEEVLLGNILISGLADEDGDLTDVSGMDLGRIAQCLMSITEKTPVDMAKAILVYDFC